MKQQDIVVNTAKKLLRENPSGMRLAQLVYAIEAEKPELKVLLQATYATGPVLHKSLCKDLGRPQNHIRLIRFFASSRFCAH